MNDRTAQIRHVLVHINGIMTAFRRVSSSTLQNHFILKRAAERVIILVSEAMADLNNDAIPLAAAAIYNTAALLRRGTVNHLQLWDIVTVRFPELRMDLEAALYAACQDDVRIEEAE